MPACCFESCPLTYMQGRVAAYEGASVKLAENEYGSRFHPTMNRPITLGGPADIGQCPNDVRPNDLPIVRSSRAAVLLITTEKLYTRLMFTPNIDRMSANCLPLILWLPSGPLLGIGRYPFISNPSPDFSPTSSHRTMPWNRVHHLTSGVKCNTWISFGLRLVYGARILPVSPFPCGLCAEAGGGREILVRIHGLRCPLRFCFARS